MSTEEEIQAQRLKNLKPFEKGHRAGAGNNNKPQLKTILKKLLKQKISKENPLDENDFDLKTSEELLNLALIARGLKGDTKAIDMIYDRIEGKVTQKIDVKDNSAMHAIKQQIRDKMKEDEVKNE